MTKMMAENGGKEAEDKRQNGTAAEFEYAKFDLWIQ